MLKAIGYGIRFQRRKLLAEKVLWPTGLVEKRGVMSKPGPMLKFNPCLNLNGTCGL